MISSPKDDLKLVMMRVMAAVNAFQLLLLCIIAIDFVIGSADTKCTYAVDKVMIILTAIGFISIAATIPSNVRKREKLSFILEILVFIIFLVNVIFCADKKNADSYHRNFHISIILVFAVQFFLLIYLIAKQCNESKNKGISNRENNYYLNADFQEPKETFMPQDSEETIELDRSFDSDSIELFGCRSVFLDTSRETQNSEVALIEDEERIEGILKCKKVLDETCTTFKSNGECGIVESSCIKPQRTNKKVKIVFEETFSGLYCNSATVLENEIVEPNLENNFSEESERKTFLHSVERENAKINPISNLHSSSTSINSNSQTSIDENESMVSEYKDSFLKIEGSEHCLNVEDCGHRSNIDQNISKLPSDKKEMGVNANDLFLENPKMKEELIEALAFAKRLTVINNWKKFILEK